jgi:hypothetical protein
VIPVSGSLTMETGEAASTVRGGCGSTAGEVHGLHVGGAVGATTGSAGATTNSDDGEAGGAE